MLNTISSQILSAFSKFEKIKLSEDFKKCKKYSKNSISNKNLKNF
jgi:hypothetical protein